MLLMYNFHLIILLLVLLIDFLLILLCSLLLERREKDSMSNWEGKSVGYNSSTKVCIYY